MSAFLTRGLVAALIASASITGCTGKAPSGGPHGAGKPVPITVAYVRLGEASTGAPHVDSPKWVLEEAASAGLVIHSIGVWQELPKAEEYRLLVTNREIVNCRVVETREDGQVVFEASAHVSRSRKRLVLGPGAKESGLVHLSGQDAVAVRLGWEGQAPPPIFARALLVHTDSGGRRSWPANLPDWVVEVLKGPTFRATGCEDLDAGRWVELNADQRSLGRTAASGEVLARIGARDRNGCASVSATLPNRKNERGRLVRRGATVSPVMPGNERPGTICTFEQAGQGSYIAVVFHYGAVDTAGRSGSSSGVNAPVGWASPSGEPTYPRKLTIAQRQLLVRLGDAKWFTPGATGESKEHQERRRREFTALLDKIKTAGLPGLATAAGIEVSQSKIKNTSQHDVLIVLQHETGQDVAIRTHWLTAGQAIPNRSAFSGWGRVWILSPRKKRDTEQQDELDRE